ncbi:MAG: 50S ribosomal protein L6 [Candidatus Levyibacteriota bacterium]
MSKIGRMPIIIPEGVTVTVTNGQVSVAGSKGTMQYILPNGISAVTEDGKVVIALKNVSEDNKALFGLTRATVANLVKGVLSGFEKKLELSGVGYRAQGAGTDLTLSLGFSHPVKVKAPNGITFTVTENVITVSGSDKALVGDVAAKIRAIRPPEPYKGKGIKYVGEKIRRKAGKAAKAVGGAPGGAK